MKPVDACTIVSNNYLAQARVFAESYQRHHPGARVFVCVVDRPSPRIAYAALPFVTIFAEELAIPGFLNFAFRYDILEMNTAVKPYLVSYLRDRHGLDRVLYFDPDILVLDELDGIARALDEHPMVLTPHLTQPLPDGPHPHERRILMMGVYNLGFWGTRLDDSTADYIRWLSGRLHQFCLNDPEHGLFVDQAWMDFAPAFVSNVGVLRDEIYNIAYWNLPHRHPQLRDGQWFVNDRRAGFVHFSGLDLDSLTTISRHQNRVNLDLRPELRPLFEQYRRLLLAAGQERLGDEHYGFGAFEGGQITIPRIARRLLQRVDPHGRRWPDPFAIHCHDSYFEWLVERLECRGGFMNRVALSLWEEREDLLREFPQVCGRDLPRYRNWLVDKGEGERAGLPQVFLTGLAGRTDPDGPTFSYELHPYDATVADTGAQLLSSLDLTKPGDLAAWLNDPLPGTSHSQPVLTRLSLILYRQREDVQIAFPDPLGKDQQAFAHWFVTNAKTEFDLHHSLVDPVLRSLTLKGRLSSRLRLAGGWRRSPSLNGVSAPPVAEPEWTPLVTASPATPTAGVNVMGYFGLDTGVGQIGRGTLAALNAAGIPTAALPLDEDPWGKVVHGRIRHPAGSPFPVTLIHANADQTVRVLSTLAKAATTGGYNIGYWFWELAHLPLAYAASFGDLSELWAPSQFCAESFAPLATCPIRHVPPHVPAPNAGVLDRSALGMDPDRFYFFSCFDVCSIPERKNPQAAIEAIRQLQGEAGRPVGLLLRINRAERQPVLLAQLRELARDLPVVFHTGDAPRETLDSMLGVSDAFLSLHRSEGLGLLPIETLYLEKPVVATGYGGVTDYLDATTGYPVPFRLARLEHDHPPYPRGAVWAEPNIEAAAALMHQVVSRPAEAAARAAAGHRRVEELYGLPAAIERLTGELDRVFAGLGTSLAARSPRRGASRDTGVRSNEMALP